MLRRRAARGTGWQPRQARGALIAAIRPLALKNCVPGFPDDKDVEPLDAMLASENPSIDAGGAFRMTTELFVILSQRSPGVARRLT